MVRSFLIKALFVTGFFHLFRFFNRRKLLILKYHHISDLQDREFERSTKFEVGVSKENFRKQVEYLSRYYNIVPLSEILEREGSYLAAITFDDGYEDNFSNAFPVLKEHRAPGTFFIATKFVEERCCYWFDEVKSVLRSPGFFDKVKEGGYGLPDDFIEVLAQSKRQVREDWIRLLGRIKNYLERQEKSKKEEVLSSLKSIAVFENENVEREFKVMTWSQVKEVGEEGMEIGGHTHSHQHLTALSRGEIEEEMERSGSYFQRELGQSPKAFCFPAGKYSEESVDCVEKAGYGLAVTSDHDLALRNSSRFLLPRISVLNEDLPFFAANVTGFFHMTTFIKKMLGVARGK